MMSLKVARLWGAVFLICGASANAAVVRICDSDKNCYIFRDVPGCSEWGLAAGTTCVDLDIAFSVPLTSHSFGNKNISIQYLGGKQITATVLDKQGKAVRKTKLLDFNRYAGTGYLGVAAKINDTTVNFPVAGKGGGHRYRRILLEILMLRLDRSTKVPIEMRSWRVDVTNPDSLAPICD